jgi:hypothetical protein
VEKVVQQARRIARMVKIAASHGPYRATCLPQSLTLWLLLRRRGIASSLRIGVRKEISRLDAHAWVEIDGIVVNDRMDVPDRFVPFAGAILAVEERPT